MLGDSGQTTSKLLLHINGESGHCYGGSGKDPSPFSGTFSAVVGTVKAEQT